MFRPQCSAGFSLLELILALAVSVFVVGVSLQIMADYQQRYRGDVEINELERDLRAVLDLLGRDTGRAGYHHFQMRSLLTPLTPSPLKVTAEVDDSSGFFPGLLVRVDAGDKEEVVRIDAVPSQTSITAVFQQAHLAGAVIMPVGPFPTGILASSSGNILQLYGTIEDNDKVQYIEYRCDPAAGTLTRSVSPINASVQNKPDVLLRQLVGNPSGTPCFQYHQETHTGTTYTLQVTVALSAETEIDDPQMDETIVRSSSLAIAPRNIVAAYKLARQGATNRLQSEPPGLPIPPAQ